MNLSVHRKTSDSISREPQKLLSVERLLRSLRGKRTQDFKDTNFLFDEAEHQCMGSIISVDMETKQLDPRLEAMFIVHNEEITKH